ncbi:MAG: hypothetical protein MI723_17425, partial [Caulobacterales bacterium]|nr:hypothetical protein [Caulobacterales bacterium]
VDHGRVAFMLASWRSGAAIEQPSFHAGYQLKPGAPTRARVGSARYKMFVDGREGFVEDVGDERRLIRDMKRAFVMRVEAVSVRGTATAYEFSLKGVTNALRAMQNECR